MYDSSAKLGSSLLNGNMVQLGDFKQCVAVQRSPEHLGGGPSITGRYCNVAVYMEPTGPSSKWRELHSLLDVMKSHEAMSNAHQLVFKFLFFVKHINIKVMKIDRRMTCTFPRLVPCKLDSAFLTRAHIWTWKIA